MSETACGEHVEERTRKIVRDLRASGHRVTPQRVAIVREFIGRCDHPSAEAIHRSLADEFPMMALSTVYNTLRLLTEMGEAVEVSPATPETRFDPDTGDHCHLTCLSCNRIVDLPLESCERRDQTAKIALDSGFAPARIVYQIFGYCADCREDEERGAS
jgi:Fur family transcriptional regulator, peroxide stress response regulator